MAVISAGQNEDRQMKILKAKESGHKETIIDVKSKSVICHHVTAHPSLEKGCRYQLKTTFDFSDCPMEYLLKAAAENCVISWRRPFKDVAKPKNDEWNNRIVKAADVISMPASKLDKAAKVIAGFDAETLKALGLERVEKK